MTIIEQIRTMIERHPHINRIIISSEEHKQITRQVNRERSADAHPIAVNELFGRPLIVRRPLVKMQSFFWPIRTCKAVHETFDDPALHPARLVLVMNQHIPHPRHGLPGYYALADLPQRGSMSELVVSTGWVEMDDIFRVYPSQFIVVTGKPGSGKSTFVFNLLSQLSWKQNYRHWLYVPENEAAIMDKLELIYGMGPAQFGVFAHTRCFIQSSADEHYNDDPRTIEWILNAAYEAWQRDQINTVTIDPWNELDEARLRGESETEYIGRCLRLIKRFGRETGCTMIVVAHPTKVDNDRDVRLSDINGSAHWWNRSDAGLIVMREVGKRESKVVVAKVREQPVAGRPGHCIFLVDPDTGMFREQQGGGVAL